MTLVQPTPDMRVKIREELREPESLDAVDRDVAQIHEWLKLQPHLPKDMGKFHFAIRQLQSALRPCLPFTDDQRLRTFLRGCKFSLEKVKKKLDMYYTMRNAVPEFFSNRDIDRPELAEILNQM